MSLNYLWGSHAWIYLHYVSFNYPIIPNDDDKQNYKNFYYNLKYTLPCNDCKLHFSQMIENLPIDQFLNNRWSLMWWLYIVHTLVNIRLNKDKFYYFDELLLLYKDYKCDKCSLKKPDDTKEFTCEDIKKYILENYSEITSKMYYNYVQKLYN